MAFSKLDGKGIDLSSNVLTSFASAGIDDNATSTALTIDANGNVDIAGNLITGDSTDISMSSASAGQLNLDGNGYNGAIALDASGMHIYHNSGSRAIIFGVNETERMRIASSGNVGINTTTPEHNLDITDTTPTILLRDNRTGLGAGNTLGSILFYNNESSTAGGARVTGSIKSVAKDNYGRTELVFGTHTTDTKTNFGDPGTYTDSTIERMRINNAGDLLVAQTSGSSADTGHILNTNGTAFHIRDGGVSFVLDRLTSDGEMALFRKDGVTIGKITTRSAQFAIGKAGTGIEFNDANDAIIPFSPNANNTRDNALDLGMSSVRFDDIYATNGTIQTSDRNEKQDIEELTEAEQRVAVAAKALLRKFRWKSSVAEKGESARIHYGIIAQDLQAAFAAEGLNAGNYAMFINTTWTDEESGEERSRMGVRYSELLAFIIAAI